MTLREKVETMEAFERGEEIQVDKGRYACWALTKEPSWNWSENNYRIKPKPKPTVVIEKWLCYDNLAESYSIVEESNIDGFINDDRAYLSKVRLLDTYEVTL